MGMTENIVDKGNLRVEEQEERQFYLARTERHARLLSDLAGDIQPPVR